MLLDGQATSRHTVLIGVSAILGIEAIDDDGRRWELVPVDEASPTQVPSPEHRLLALLGAIDETTADYIRAAASRVPPSVISDLVEILGRKSSSDPAGYVVATLQRELEARGPGA